MNYLVLGAGAIGTYIGGSLLRSGNPVVFLERPQAADRIREQGLELEMGGSTYKVGDVAVYSHLPEALQQKVDVVLFAMKSFDTETAARELAGFSSQYQAVCCLQNGVENEERIERILGRERVIGGSVTSAVERLDAGRVRLEKTRGVGIAADHPLAPLIVSDLSRAGIQARLYPNLRDLKWSKMLSNLLANATSAILDMSPSEVYSDPLAYRIERAQLMEALEVMRQSHIHVINLPGAPLRLLMFVVRSAPESLARRLLARVLGRGRGGKMPSFHIDLHANKQVLESGYLNGAVSRFGRLCHVPTPVNDCLDRTLERLVHDRALRHEFARKPDRLWAEVRHFSG